MNRWARDKRDDDGTTRRLVIPPGVAAPRCAFCTGEIRDASMALVIWNDHPQEGRPFDGFRFVHKIECDPGRRVAARARSRVDRA